MTMMKTVNYIVHSTQFIAEIFEHPVPAVSSKQCQKNERILLQLSVPIKRVLRLLSVDMTSRTSSGTPCGISKVPGTKCITMRNKISSEVITIRT